MNNYDIVIVGAGIAGMTAAIYAKRAGKTVLVLEKKACGGQALETAVIKNWPGEVEITGADLTEKIYHQVNNLGAEVRFETLERVDKKENARGETIFDVKTDENEYSCGAIIIATGTVPRELLDLDFPNVSYCATCDGALYKNKTVAVIGNGNSALYEALYLGDLVKKVYFIHRRDGFNGDKVLVDRLKALGNAEILVIPDVYEMNKRLRELSVDGVFVAIGKEPATKEFADLLERDKDGYIITDEECRTSESGVYAVGDCRAKDLRQLVTAAADGAIAVNAVTKDLK